LRYLSCCGGLADQRVLHLQATMNQTTGSSPKLKQRPAGMWEGEMEKELAPRRARLAKGKGKNHRSWTRARRLLMAKCGQAGLRMVTGLSLDLGRSWMGTSSIVMATRARRRQFRACTTLLSSPSTTRIELHTLSLVRTYFFSHTMALSGWQKSSRPSGVGHT